MRYCKVANTNPSPDRYSYYRMYLDKQNKERQEVYFKGRDDWVGWVSSVFWGSENKIEISRLEILVACGVEAVR